MSEKSDELKRLDKELGVIREILDALSQLDEDARCRVLWYVNERPADGGELR